MEVHIRSVWSAFSLAIAAGILTGCGGGGGGGAAVRPTPPPVAPAIARAPSPGHAPPGDESPFVDSHLAGNVGGAHYLGAMGEGAVIGVADTGVDDTRAALAGKIDAQLTFVDANGNDLSRDDASGHGTAMSTVISGAVTGEWPGGVAPGSSIVSARVASDVEDQYGQHALGAGIGPSGMAGVNRALADAGARIIVNGWRIPDWQDQATTEQWAEAYREFVVDRGGLVVFGTGDEGGSDSMRSQPSTIASLPGQPGAGFLDGGWLAVTAVSPQSNVAGKLGQPVGYAQACGAAMHYCMAAIGNVMVPSASGTLETWGGTPLAAAQVAAAAALVWSVYPYFDNALVMQTLLGNADDIGAPGVDPEFGYGLLNAGMAVGGPRRFDWGDVTVDFAGTSTWEHAIDGEGGLIKKGPGTLIFAGGAGFTGLAQILEGEVVLDMLGGSARIAPGATLSTPWSQALIRGDVENSGTLKIGRANILIEGSYTQSADAVLSLRVGASLIVRKAATLDGWLHFYDVFPDYVVSERFVLIETFEEGHSGQFKGFTTAPGLFLDATLDYSRPEGVWIEINRLDVAATAQALGLSAASRSGANRVEGAFRALDAGLQAAPDAFLRAAGHLQATSDRGAAERSLASLSGELHATDAALAMLAMEGSRHQLEQRLDARPGSGAWAAMLDGTRSVGDFGVDQRGWMMGQSLRTAATTFGAAFSHTESAVWNARRSDRGRDLHHSGQLFVVRDLGNSYLMGTASFGRIQRDLERELVIGSDWSGTGSRYIDHYLGAGIQAGRHFAMGNATLTPYAGAQLLELSRGAFSESDAAGLGLRADGSALEATRALAGARYRQGWRIGDARVDLHGRVEWQRALSQQGAIDASFTAIDAPAPIALDVLGPESALVGAGVGIQWRAAHFSLDTARRTSPLGANNTILLQGLYRF